MSQAAVGGVNGGRGRAPRVRIGAGELHAAADGCVVGTLLGSCVAVALYDRSAGVGGLNHFLLARGDQRGREAMYGQGAIDLLIAALLRLGARRDRLEAKCFGGAAVLDALGSSRVPQDNVAFARTYLEELRIPIVAERTGGTSALEVLLETHTGRAQVREHRTSAAPSAAR